MSDSGTLWTVQPTRLLCPWNSPGKNKYWTGLPFLSPGDLSDPEIKLRSPALQADSLLSKPPGKGEVGRANSNFVWEYGKGQQADGIIMVLEQEYFSLYG